MKEFFVKVRCGFSIECFVAFLALLFSFHTNAKEFYLSPSGDDKNPGTRSLPFKTLERARDEIRALPMEIRGAESIKVILLEGKHFINQAFELESVDSGTEAFPIIYMGERGKKVELIGGIEIDGFEKKEDGLWVMNISYLKNITFEQLFVNGERAIRARYPNEGEFVGIQGVEEIVLTKGIGSFADSALQNVRFADELARRFSESDFERASAILYHKWDVTKKRVDWIDLDKSEFQVSGRGMSPVNKLNKNSRLYFENVRSGLDSPGEWYVEDNGDLYYFPRKGESLNETAVVIPTLDKFIVIKGESTDKAVRNLMFQNITFRASRFIMPKEGIDSDQAASSRDAVVMVDFGKKIIFENCEIVNTGIWGIWFREGCFDNKVNKNYFHDLGAGAVKIGVAEKSPPPKKEDSLKISKRNIIDNNIIKGGGKVFPNAVGVAIFHASDNVVSHNEISNLRYSGISVGWTWGYGDSHAKRNIIEYNHVHHLGWGELSDMGGIYTLGVSDGTIIRNNVIHHVYSLHQNKAWGIYLDAGSSNIIVENNLVYSCESGGFFLHYGKDNFVTNNLFYNNIKFQINASKVESHVSFEFTRNIVHFNSGLLTGAKWDKIGMKSDRNIYWNMQNKNLLFGELNMEQWKKKLGKDKNSHIINPRIKSINPLKFSSTKAIRKIGFVPFDVEKAGVYGDNSWIEKAKLSKEVTRAYDEAILN